MKVTRRLVILSAAYLVNRAAGFVTTITRNAGGNAASSGGRRPRTTETQALQRASIATYPPGIASNTAMLATATYTSFEDMLEKEPGPLLVDFYATWCGPCQQMGETLKEVGPKMKGEVKIMKIDTDKYPALTEKFAVAGLPTLILFKKGKELQRIEGFLPGDQLLQQVRYFLQGAEVAEGAATSAQQASACPPQPPQDACAPPVAAAEQDACAPAPKDACSPPPRDSCAPPAPQS